MKFLVTVLFFFPLFGFSQDYRTYYKLINSAEKSIIDSNILTANKYYKRAFTFVDKPNSNDMYNYALTCALLGKSKSGKAIKYLNKLRSLGLCDSLIALETLFNNNNIKVKLFKSKIKKNKFYNKDVALSLEELYNKDQFYRLKENSYKFYKYNIFKADSLNDYSLRQIIEKYNYPNEYLIGIENCQLSNSFKFEIVIWHQTTLNSFYDYTTILTKAVKDGKLNPKRAAALLENHLGKEKYASTPFFNVSCDNCSPEIKNEISGKLYCYKYLEKIKTKINIERESLYLENIEDFERKFIFDLTSKRYNFYCSSNIPRYFFEDENELKRFISNKQIYFFP